ncbi:molybdopterin molybdotransferase MoeA [Corynebacterium sp. LK2590]|uniref:molybdopterin molybdotransferase MoeA n=1 Tax=unclassified Corynebacterium TaxID=2624378 RepID=UPI0034CECABE
MHHPSSCSVAEHLSRILGLVGPLPAVEVAADELTSGLFCAADATCRIPVPAFHNSAMDGFLVHRADLGSGSATLPVLGDVPAGSAPQEVPAGAAVRIMTGAPIADPLDPELVVVPVELTNIPAGPTPLPETVTITGADPARPHIRRAGDNLAVGDIAVRAGSRVDPGVIAACHSAGLNTLPVHRTPRVAVISTGDELVSLGDGPWSLGPGQIPDSNRPMLAQLVRDSGPVELTHLHAGDSDGAAGRSDSFVALTKEAAQTHDLIITSGGVSAGAFDIVHTSAQAHASNAWFGDVNQKPGAPQGVSIWGSTPMISLPGNPVATFVSFHLYVAPALRALRGDPHPALRRRGIVRAGENFPDTRDRPAWLPVRVDYADNPPAAFPFNGRRLGSHMVANLAGTAGMVGLDAHAAGPRAGDTVEITWF